MKSSESSGSASPTKSSSPDSGTNFLESASRELQRKLDVSLMTIPPAEYLKDDPENFLQLCHLLGHTKLYRSPIYDRFVNFLHSPGHRKIINMPRGAYKSTFLCDFAIKRVIQNPNIRILYASETYSNSKDYVAMIAKTFESNENLHRVFGDDWMPESRTGRQWRAERIVVAKRTDHSKKEATVTSAGIDVTKVGMHYDLIIVDDPVSQRNTITEGQIAKTLAWYQLLLSILEPDGTIIICGTRYDDEDLYGSILARNVELEALWISLPEAQKTPDMMPYDIIVEQALDSKGEPRFAHFSKGFLSQKRIEQGSHIFACQYQNMPFGNDASVFHREHFRLIRKDDIPRTMNLYLLTDTATTPDGCDSVIFVIGKDSLNKCYVLDGMVWRGQPHTYVENFLSMWIKWLPRKALLEKIPINDNFASMIEREAISRQIHIRLEFVMGRTTENKDSRIIASQAQYEAGNIWFSDSLPKQLIRMENGRIEGEIVHQYLRFRPNSGGRKDIPDCLSDAFKTDRHTGAELCPYPRRRAGDTSEPGIINNRIAVPRRMRIPREAASEDFWSKQKRLSDARGRK
jgi:hypothetical protein